jgi:hypothetical protein
MLQYPELVCTTPATINKWEDCLGMRLKLPGRTWLQMVGTAMEQRGQIAPVRVIRTPLGFGDVTSGPRVVELC